MNMFVTFVLKYIIKKIKVGPERYHRIGRFSDCMFSP